jgi:flagellar motor component MotA
VHPASGAGGHARGAAPATAVEFGRKMIFRDERPSFSEITRRSQAIKS